MKRSAWRWMVGGLCGAAALPTLAAGQAPTGAPPAPVVRPATSTTTSTAARATEVAVESAWLADPVTFPYRLRAKVTPQGVEVVGYVPTSGVKERAVQAASAAAGVPLVDRITVQANMQIVFPGSTPENFADEAKQRLEQVPAKATDQIELRVQSNGQVTLYGKVSSLEDKLRFAKALQGLQGCAAVRNELAILSEPTLIETLPAPTPATLPTLVPTTSQPPAAPAPVVAGKTNMLERPTPPPAPVVASKTTTPERPPLAAPVPAATNQRMPTKVTPAPLPTSMTTKSTPPAANPVARDAAAQRPATPTVPTAPPITVAASHVEPTIPALPVTMVPTPPEVLAKLEPPPLAPPVPAKPTADLLAAPVPARPTAEMLLPPMPLPPAVAKPAAPPAAAKKPLGTPAIIFYEDDPVPPANGRP